MISGRGHLLDGFMYACNLRGQRDRSGSEARTQTTSLSTTDTPTWAIRSFHVDGSFQAPETSMLTYISSSLTQYGHFFLLNYPGPPPTPHRTADGQHQQNLRVNPRKPTSTSTDDGPPFTELPRHFFRTFRSVPFERWQMLLPDHRFTSRTTLSRG